MIARWSMKNRSFANLSSHLAIWLVVCLIPSANLHAAWQQPAPAVEIKDSRDLWDHAIGPRDSIHTSLNTFRAIQMGQTNVTLDVIVSENGVVGSAHAIEGPAQFFEQAERLEMQRRFTPFTKDGMIVRAKIHDYVSILPPEEWLEPHLPFPAQIDMSTVRIGLSRTGCYGTCPAYTVTISGDGSVEFDGNSFVLVPGRHHAHISPNAVRNLLDAFRQGDFFSARDAYTANWTDNPTQTISLAIGERKKSVVDYVGTEAGLPDAVKDLERRIDETAETERWIKGTAETLPSLTAEKWDFASASPENIALYESAIEHKDTAMVDRFIAARAPVSTLDAWGKTPLSAASETGDLDLVQRMVGKQRTFPQPVLSTCLATGARSGSLDLVTFWIDLGANPVLAPPSGRGPQSMSILANSIMSGNPAVVQKLLEYKVDLNERVNERPLINWALYAHKPEHVPAIITLLANAGADPDARGHLNQTALFDTVFVPDAIPALVAAGAHINAQDSLGQTPLINTAFAEPVVRQLLSAGADPTIVAKNGDTALKRAQQFQCPACAALIQEALDKRRAQVAQ
jgi:ankyrin repeat protein